MARKKRGQTPAVIPIDAFCEWLVRVTEVHNKIMIKEMRKYLAPKRNAPR